MRTRCGEVLVELVKAGLATAHVERVRTDDRVIEMVHFEIADAGRRRSAQASHDADRAARPSGAHGARELWSALA